MEKIEKQVANISPRLAAINKRIATAAKRAGRQLADVNLIGVSKFHTAKHIAAFLNAGGQMLGESRAQEAVKKVAELSDSGIYPEWHFIGHLQKNKVKYLLDGFSLIHSVDSLELAAEISRQVLAKKLKKMDILLQVNIAAEQSKFGLKPEGVMETAKQVAELGGVGLRGLMAMPPPADKPEDNRVWFRQMWDMMERLQTCNIDKAKLDILSMGMSNDFEVAIEEGATHIRVGSAIFGERYVK